jgi:hypothetical protein
MRTMFQVMNPTAFPKAPGSKLPAVFVLAAATLFGLTSFGTMEAQTPAPGTAPMTTAAPGTVAVHGEGVKALAENAVTKYDNRYEIYGGLAYANGQAGQDLTQHYNMGGGELMGTYWFGPVLRIPNNHLGVVADFRFGAGTTPVLPTGAQFGLNRVTVRQYIFGGGLQYRWIKDRYAAVDFHAIAGGAYGDFDSAIDGYPAGQQQAPNAAYVGLYDNHFAPWAAAGGSIDFNYSPKVAVRLQPDITFEHFGTSTREFFGISMGLVYRLGKR